MGKNIVVLSDGTGQRGGLLFDERRSNIYKLYRATRCGPDSPINPSEQLAFYDPGIGTLPEGLGGFWAIERWVYNIVSQATGLGLTRNIVDCYAAIIRMWQPGDRIFLFGFSRGAYTVRCVAAVLGFCGVPTRMKDGTPLRRDETSARKIAREAVKKVYQHVSSPQDTKYVPQRAALAARFRQKYGSGVDGKSNAYPHFIGVFDTVASIANDGSILFVALLSVSLIAFASLALWFFFPSINVWDWLWIVTGILAGTGAIAYAATHLKVACGLTEFPWWKTLHFTSARMKFYDQQLNTNVGWARHALAIDEYRADFDRVPWGNIHECRTTAPGEPVWLQQVWFAGDHSDVGGSYIENESRLSDISLEWMIDAAVHVPNGLEVDRSVLHLFPAADGMQHDETKGYLFRFAKRIVRSIPVDAKLHPSVYDRFRLPAILQYDLMLPYRPEALRHHESLRDYYA
jgi:uncharacterized protein (DUF2235 family)